MLNRKLSAFEFELALLYPNRFEIVQNSTYIPCIFVLIFNKVPILTNYILKLIRCLIFQWKWMNGKKVVGYNVYSPEWIVCFLSIIPVNAFFKSGNKPVVKLYSSHV